MIRQTIPYGEYPVSKVEFSLNYSDTSSSSSSFNGCQLGDQVISHYDEGTGV